MQLIALTGGIASGKSTVAARLVEHGAVLVDADQLAREAVAPGSAGLKQIAERFGPDVVTASGELDRAALGAIVFADPESLADLNAITHPIVRELGEVAIRAAGEADHDAVVVYDVPLLAETDASFDWDLVVVTEAPTALRVSRMTQLRGMSEEDARRRIANQASDRERRSLADVLIDTGGSLQATIDQADQLWRQLEATSETQRTNPAGTGQRRR